MGEGVKESFDIFNFQPYSSKYFCTVKVVPYQTPKFLSLKKFFKRRSNNKESDVFGDIHTNYFSSASKLEKVASRYMKKD